MENCRRRDCFRSRFAWILLSFALSITPGCSRPDVFHWTDTGANSPATAPNLPFHPDPEHATDDNARPALPEDGKTATTTPFRAAGRLGPYTLPAGTLITVRLESSLAISQVRAGDTFLASVSGPITVDGNIVVEGGAPVSGRVESAQPSVDGPGLTRDRGFVRLTLNSLTLDGSVLPLQTSSLFARGTWQSNPHSISMRADAASGSFQVQQGRRLTFRLTAPLTFTAPNSIANRQLPGASIE